MSKLVRGLNLREAVAINMIDMVGIGPFITIPYVIGAMSGPQCILAWLLGAILSFMDGFVWAELGAKWPEAGGSYVFLQHLYGKEKWGRLMSFLYIWQTTFQAPLVIASGAIGFSQYLTYLVPLEPMYQKMVSGALVIFVCILLYRKITDIGKISTIMGIVVIGTLLWLIASGMYNLNPAMAFTFNKEAMDFTPAFFFGLGLASTKTIYSFLGYYNVCHLGSEIKEPEKNIPKSIFISIAGISALYLLMQTAVSGVIPWQEAKESTFIVSTFFERIYGPNAAIIATVLILLIAISSLFAVMLGYSRVPYAAAVEGNYFKVFAKVHPTKNFPNASLLILASVAFVFSLLFRMKEVITSIIVMRILVQFVGQSAGLIALHYKNKELKFPYKMILFPIPPILGILVWGFIFFSSGWVYIGGAVAFLLLGALFFLSQSYSNKQWPFGESMA
ncbi:MAG: amino acid permease [Bacteroidetes bacterium B1(2017)]|nr:MAG: amino acid permease [Bacteroidetes bacterium B1(2017)]